MSLTRRRLRLVDSSPPIWELRHSGGRPLCSSQRWPRARSCLLLTRAARVFAESLELPLARCAAATLRFCRSDRHHASTLTARHPLQFGYGPGSPVATLCSLGGKVLMLGAPLDTMTLLHHAEHLATLPAKRVISFDEESQAERRSRGIGSRSTTRHEQSLRRSMTPTKNRSRPWSTSSPRQTARHSLRSDMHRQCSSTQVRSSPSPYSGSNARYRSEHLATKPSHGFRS